MKALEDWGSGMRTCCTKRIITLAVMDWAAVWTWVATTDWVGLTTKVSVIGFNLTVGFMAAWNYVKAQRLKMRREEEEAMKDSLGRQLEEVSRRATEERTELMESIREKDERIKLAFDESKSLRETIDAERRSIHAQRGEMQQAALLQMEESRTLRGQIGELTRELAGARRELYSAKQHAEEIATRTITEVGNIVTNNTPRPEEKTQ